MPKLEASRVFPGTVSIVVCVCVSCVHLLLVYLDNLYLYVYAHMRTCTGPRRVFAGRPSRVPGMCLQLRVHVRVRAGMCGSEREIERERKREFVCMFYLCVYVCACTRNAHTLSHHARAHTDTQNSRTQGNDVLELQVLPVLARAFALRIERSVLYHDLSFDVSTCHVHR